MTGTPHFYGNLEWGGDEWVLVNGQVPDRISHRTYFDIDPITGRSHRQILRQEISLRLEANSLFRILFSSQERCTVPAKTFAGESGYGCFTYIPILWYEDMNNVIPDDLLKIETHY